MKRTTKSFFAGLTFAAIGTVVHPSNAEALPIGAALVHGCTGDAAAGTELMNAALSECGLTKGYKSACQVLSGNPWICNSPDGPQTQPDRICSGSSAEVTINGNLAVPVGWSVTGTIQGTVTIKATIKAPETCDATPVLNVTGPAGSFVAEKGILETNAIFKLSGSFTLTGPGGVSFTVSASASCTSLMTAPVYAAADTNACTADEPTDEEEEEPECTDDTSDGACGEGVVMGPAAVGSR